MDRRTTTNRATGRRVISVAQYAAVLNRAVRAAGPAIIEGEIQEPRARKVGVLRFMLADGDGNALSCTYLPWLIDTPLSHMPRHGDLVRVLVREPEFHAK